MLHTIFAAKFEQIIHQHVHLRRESQSHVLMRLYPIDKSLNDQSQNEPISSSGIKI
jgi:hypothetical protein